MFIEIICDMNCNLSLSYREIIGIVGRMECLIGMAFDDFVMVAADQTNAR